MKTTNPCFEERLREYELDQRQRAQDEADRDHDLIPVKPWMVPQDSDPDKRWTFLDGLWEWMTPHEAYTPVKYRDTDGAMKWTR